MSTAVLDKPAEKSAVVAAEPRQIRHAEDRGVLVLFGADVTEQGLIDDYYEYRDYNAGQPGKLDRATLHGLAVEQRKRLRKKGK